MNDFYVGVAEIIEIDSVDTGTELNSGAAPWDSLALVSVIALIDELFGRTVNGQKLSECKTVGDIERLLG